MASMLVFVIAFAVGCLSGVVVALWSNRHGAGKSRRASPFWPIPSDETDTIPPYMRR